MFLFGGAVAKCAPILEVLVWYKLRKIKLALRQSKNHPSITNIII